jgi:hypothetical protein
VVISVAEIFMHFTASMHVQVYKLDLEITERDLIVGLNHSSNALF